MNRKKYLELPLYKRMSLLTDALALASKDKTTPDVSLICLAMQYYPYLELEDFEKIPTSVIQYFELIYDYWEG